MSFPETVSRAGFFLLSLSVLTAATRAEVVENEPLDFKVKIQNEAVIASEQICRIYVTAGTNQFALVLPRDFRVDSSDRHQLVFEHRESRCFITVRVLKSGGTEVSASEYRKRILRQYPTAEIIAEMSKSTGEGLGSAFDLERPSPILGSERLRVVYMGTPNGCVEFTLHSKPDSLNQDERCLDSLLWSFKSDCSGKIVPIEAPSRPPSS